MTIKTREITAEIGRGYSIDDLINEFLEDEQNIELIDVKYQTVAYEEYREITVLSSALVIYKEKSNE